MLKNVVDTHRLMYRNARIRAIDLSDRTTAIPFFNITDQTLPDEDIGYEVHTDAAGYLYYGTNSQPIQCLAVKKSAIIQVDITGNNAWDIEWIIRGEPEDDYVKVQDIHKAYYADGTLAWDPLDDDWHMPDWALKSEIGRGEWAEGEMIVTETTPYDLNIDKWTHVVSVRQGHAAAYRITYTKGRYGQTVLINNISDTDVDIVAQHKIGAHIYNTRITIPAGMQSQAVYNTGVGWYLPNPNVIVTDYVIDHVDAGVTTVFVDLQNNTDIKRIIYKPSVNESGVTIAILARASYDMRTVNILNETSVTVNVGWRIDDGSTHNYRVETVPAYGAMEYGHDGACDGSQSRLIGGHSSESATVRDRRIYLIETADVFWGTCDVATDLVGVWLSVKILAKGGSVSGTQNHTIKVTVNGNQVYSIDTTANHLMNKSTADPVGVSANLQLVSLMIRICKTTIDDTEYDYTDVVAIGGAAL